MTSGNNHLSPEKIRSVHGVLLLGIYPPKQIAEICDVSLAAVYYQRRVLGLDGARPPKDVVPRDRTRRELVPHNAIFNYRLCFCNGCYEPAKDGKFCEQHSADATAARATAGMPEATRKKLTGARA